MPATPEQRASPYNGYHRVSDAREDPELTHTDPRTPCGEYFRRFWMPVAMSEQTGKHAIVVKVLGEELVLFRDLSGRLGLLHKHCSHRRASLEYGITAERGIRCCYHGWLFDVDGTILEVPGEPEGSPIPRRLRHGRLPGARARRPGLRLPRAAGSETRVPHARHALAARGRARPLRHRLSLQLAAGGREPDGSLPQRVPAHPGDARALQSRWGTMPVVEWRPLEDRTGIFLTNVRRWQEFIWVRTAEVMLPAIAQPPDIYQNPDREKFFPGVGITKWTVPVDDTHCRIVAWRHFNPELDLDEKGDRTRVGLNRVDFVGQTGVERSYEEGLALPGDYEAQVSQGPVTRHAEEQLATTDKGVALYRRMLRRAIRDLEAGREPPQPRPGPNGEIPTLAGDVILRVPVSNRDDRALQRRMGREIGRIVHDTMGLPRPARRAAIEERARALT